VRCERPSGSGALIWQTDPPGAQFSGLPAAGGIHQAPHPGRTRGWINLRVVRDSRAIGNNRREGARRFGNCAVFRPAGPNRLIKPTYLQS
jgi:hypothetical protein